MNTSPPHDGKKTKSRAEDIRAYILENVEREPRHIIKKTLEHFGVTRTTALRHAQTLIKEGKLIQIGTTRDIIYLLPDAQEQIFYYPINSNLDEFKVYQDSFYEYLKRLDDNLEDILSYVVTEMINNAKDHSHGTKLTIKWQRLPKQQKIIVQDNGIGIFDKIATFCKLKDIRETVLHLTKGKLTTDPANHSGEGIFFSSRIVDEFSITSNSLQYIKNNVEDDWLINTQPNKNKGTTISITISNHPKIKVVDTFKEFQTEGSLNFNITEIKVELSKLGSEKYISRSQAKRVLKGLEKFDIITLDFQKVKMVGQGFADEVFRVFQTKYPDIEIKYTNANDDILFMIQRSI